MQRRTAVVLDEAPIWLDAVQLVAERADVDVVGKTTSGVMALTLLGEHRPDLLVLELDGGPGEPDGVAVLQKAFEIVPTLRAIVLTSDSTPDRVDAAFAAGAAAYVLKTALPEDLAAAIRQAFGHSIFIANGHSVRREPSDEVAECHPLTRRELEILRLAAEGHTNAELARMLWVTEQTVKFHLSNVYRKLQVTNRTEASRWAQIHGLLPAMSASRTAA
jgi:DNA-binding NarL/FixJ family response regulator